MPPRHVNLPDERINRLEAHIQFLYKYLGMSYMLDLTDCSHPEILQALKEGDLTRAIKIYSMLSNQDQNQ